MNILSFFFKKKKPKILCKHKNTKESIVIHDKIWDMMMDNDDLEDHATYIKVTYCYKCGKILSIKPHPYRYLFYAPSDASDWIKIKEFETITGKQAKDMTMYHDR